MTREEQSAMWKEEIEKGLEKVGDLRRELKPVEFTSGLWETCRGAYGDVREDVAFLFCPKELIPDTEKLRRLDGEDKDSYEIIFDNLSESLTHHGCAGDSGRSGGGVSDAHGSVGAVPADLSGLRVL